MRYRGRSVLAHAVGGMSDQTRNKAAIAGVVLTPVLATAAMLANLALFAVIMSFAVHTLGL